MNFTRTSTYIDVSSWITLYKSKAVNRNTHGPQCIRPELQTISRDGLLLASRLLFSQGPRILEIDVLQSLLASYRPCL